MTLYTDRTLEAGPPVVADTAFQQDRVMPMKLEFDINQRMEVKNLQLGYEIHDYFQDSSPNPADRQRIDSDASGGKYLSDSSYSVARTLKLCDSGLDVGMPRQPPAEANALQVAVLVRVPMDVTSTIGDPPLIYRGYERKRCAYLL